MNALRIDLGRQTAAWRNNTPARSNGFPNVSKHLLHQTRFERKCLSPCCKQRSVDSGSKIPVFVFAGRCSEANRLIRVERLSSIHTIQTISSLYLLLKPL